MAFTYTGRKLRRIKKPNIFHHRIPVGAVVKEVVCDCPHHVDFKSDKKGIFVEDINGQCLHARRDSFIEAYDPVASTEVLGERKEGIQQQASQQEERNAEM